MADEAITVSQSGVPVEFAEDSSTVWRLFWVLITAVFTFAIYKFYEKSYLTSTRINRDQGPHKQTHRQKGAEGLLASIYCSARSQAARMRKTSVLVQALGIADQNRDFEKIADNFQTIEEVSNAIKKAGVDSSNLIFGIDFTKSNLYSGRFSFDGHSLHHLDEQKLNPYQKVISILGKTLAPFDKDGFIPAFGFGDDVTEDKRVFSFKDDESYCRGFEEVLNIYNQIVPKVTLGGPTDFAPLIREAIRIVEKSGEYHILVIIGDGQVTAERRTQDAIVEASHYPLSIIMVGVGDGPWEMMEEFDDKLPKRKFDNFQFLHFGSIVLNAEFPEATFALNALMEIPDQFNEIKTQGLLGRKVQD